MVGHKFYDQQPTRAASNPHISLKGNDLILGELGFQKMGGTKFILLQMSTGGTPNSKAVVGAPLGKE